MKDTLKYLAVMLTGLVVGLYLGFGIGTTSKVTTHEKSSISLVEFKTVTFPVVAVTSQGEGVLEYAKLTVTPGTGELFVNINPFVEPDTQYSFEEAVKAAAKLAGKDYKKYNFIIQFESNATLVGGPSAGAAIALAVYCALTNRTFPKNIAITGTIDENGNIGQVGGVFEKALAAAKSGKKVFFVPEGQSTVYKYEKIEKRREISPGIVIVEVEYKPVPINLSEYFEQKYGMEIIEVKSLRDLIEKIFKYQEG